MKNQLKIGCQIPIEHHLFASIRESFHGLGGPHRASPLGRYDEMHRPIALFLAQTSQALGDMIT